MTAFFIPGLTADVRVAEQAYADMCTRIELETGRRPDARRILRLWTHWRSVDWITEVGRPDPVRGGTVMAIFDMGADQSFVVWWRPDGVREGVREIPACSACSVVEFDR